MTEENTVEPEALADTPEARAHFFRVANAIIGALGAAYPQSDGKGAAISVLAHAAVHIISSADATPEAISHDKDLLCALIQQMAPDANLTN
jgi:hypothetical protein